MSRKKTPFFVDWLSIYQVHDFDVPEFGTDRLLRLDEEGSIVWDKLGLKSLEDGSHSTSVRISSDPATRRVTFHGNIGRFCRPDNLVNYGLAETIDKLNELMRLIGLPEFTEGERVTIGSDQGGDRRIWTGARITRIDLTQNFATGSMDLAREYLRFCGSRHHGRMKTRSYGEGQTVEIGAGSKYRYTKIYLKGDEIRAHKKNSASVYAQKIAEYCDEAGVVRFETELKSRLLRQNGIGWLGTISEDGLTEIFTAHREAAMRQDIETMDIKELSKAAQKTYAMYLAGMDHRSIMSPATWYRHRNEILKVGVDIAVDTGVTGDVQPTRVIRLTDVKPPSWYERLDGDRKALQVVAEQLRAEGMAA